MATIVASVVTALAAALVPLTTLAELTSIGTLLAFSVVCLGTLVLRYTEPDRPRAFKAPFVPVLPILAVLINGWLMLQLGYTNVLRLSTWLAIGLGVYALYGSAHSKLRQERGIR